MEDSLDLSLQEDVDPDIFRLTCFPNGTLQVPIMLPGGNASITNGSEVSLFPYFKNFSNFNKLICCLFTIHKDYLITKNSLALK